MHKAPLRGHRTAYKARSGARTYQTTSRAFEARRAAAMDVLVAVALGLIGAVCIVYWMECALC